MKTAATGGRTKMEVDTKLLAAAVRHTEAALSGRYDEQTSRELESIGAEYFRMAMGWRCTAPKAR